MVSDILSIIGDFLLTSAGGFKNVYYDYVPDKGSMLSYPIAELYSRESNYPVQPNFGTSLPIRTNIVFKCYFERENEIGSKQAMIEKSEKETLIFNILRDINLNNLTINKIKECIAKKILFH